VGIPHFFENRYISKEQSFLNEKMGSKRLFEAENKSKNLEKILAYTFR